MSAGAIRAGRAYVEIGAKDNLTKFLGGISSKMKSLGAGMSMVGGAMMGAGTAITAPLMAAAGVFNEMGSSMADMSARTGASVEQLSALSYAAEQCGASTGDLEKALRTMQKKGMSTDQLGQVADYLAGITDPAKRTAEAMRLMGKSGAALLPMLAGGSAGLEDFRKQAEQAGLVMSTADAKAADEFGDAIDQLKSQAMALVFQIGAPVAQALGSVLEYLKPILGATINWAKNNRELIGTVFKIAAGVIGAGAALVAVGGLISGFGAALGAIMTIASAVGAVLGFVFSPIGILIGVAGAAIYVFRDSIMELLAPLKSVWAFAQETFGGIADAIGSGEIGLAMQILGLSLQQAWLTILGGLKSKWLDFKAILIGTWIEAVAAIKAVWVQLYTKIAQGLAWIYAKLTGQDAEQMMAIVAEDSGVKLEGYEQDRLAAQQALFDETKAQGDAETKALQDQLALVKEKRAAAIGEASDKMDAVNEERKKKTADQAAKSPGLGEKMKLVAVDAVEATSADAFKKFNDNRNGVQEQQLAELKAIRGAIEDQDGPNIEEAPE